MEYKDFIVSTKLENDNANSAPGGVEFNTEDLVYLDDMVKVVRIEDFDRISYPTDYAIMNGAFISADRCGTKNIKSCWTWLRSAHSKSVMCEVDLYGKLDYGYVDRIAGAYCPSLQLNLEAVIGKKVQSPDIFKVSEYKEGGEVKYHAIEFGEYPKTYVGDQLNNELEDAWNSFNLTPTGKKYIGHFENGKPTYNEEYQLYDGTKYVKVSSVKHNNSSEFSDGTSAPETGTPLWVKVEPITWKIRNWDAMPQSINPDGTGEAKVIDIQTDEAIISGIPFYPNINDENGHMWQNSTIRGYLNGISVNNITMNGNTEFTAPNGGDFTEHNFLTEAFSKELQLVSKKAEVISHVKKKKRKGYGVVVDDKPMKVKDQIKFYVNNGKTFMLHGPSGIGKTRRIQELDPDFIPIALKKGMTPESVIGKTTYSTNDDSDSGKWKAPAWYKLLGEKCEKEPNKKHVVFIDEITNAGYAEQSLVFDIIQFGYITPAFGKLPENAVVVAAGNNIDESDSAYPMVEPLFRRFDGHIYLKPDLKEWLEWASEDNPNREGCPKVHPLVSAFVSANGRKVFYSAYNSDEPPKHAIDPRGWEQVSDIIYDNDGVIARELIENKVGAEIAASFIEFAKNPPLMLEDILEGNYTSEDIPNRFDAKYALALSLRNASMEELPIVRQFISKNLSPEILSTYDSIWVGEDNERAIYLDGLKQSEQSDTQSEENIEQNVEENSDDIKVPQFQVTMDDFFDKHPVGYACIYCDEEWKAKILCAIFQRMGKDKPWRDNDNIEFDQSWDVFKEKTCYYNSMYIDKLINAQSSYKLIYDFSDVDLSKYIEDPEMKILYDHRQYDYGYLPF